MHSMLSLVILIDLLLQGGNPGILSGIVKGLRASKPNKQMNRDSNSRADCSHLEEIFIRNTTPEPLSTIDEPEAVELTIGFTPLCLFCGYFSTWCSCVMSLIFYFCLEFQHLFCEFYVFIYVANSNFVQMTLTLMSLGLRHLLHPKY